MDKKVSQLIEDVLKSNDFSTTTDWLAYCLHRAVEVTLFEEKNVVIQQSIKSGIPAVGDKKIIGNDLYRLQDSNWKETYKLLCIGNFSICIEIVQDVNVEKNNLEFVNVEVKQYFISFSDPDPNDQFLLS